jgi:hypothetical protein
MHIRHLGRAALVLLFLLQSSFTCPWGSVSPGQTHQYIISAAYERLKADPAFAPDLFPALSAIKAHEGSEWTAIFLVGIGPDAEGMSAYSDHYFNPVTGEGNGPSASAKYFTYLARQNVARTVTTEASGKAAAWSAHFLADMFVPYHVIGTTRAEAERIWAEQTLKHAGTINLGFSVIGSFKLSYATPIKGGDRNFHTELSRFITQTDPSVADWFDAWYYNGNTDTMMVKTSSHVAWEAAPSYALLAPATIIGTYHRRAGSGLPGYVPTWENAAPTFTSPWDGQAGRVRELAVRSATETRKQLESYFDDPTPALAEAIRTVYSMWRTSFSGLRPAIDVQPDGPNRYKVNATIGNSASALVKSLQARLSAQGCTVSGEAVQAIVWPIPAGGRVAARAWEVKTAGTPCQLNLEVTGSYPIPDLQYASVTRTLSPLPAPPEKPVPVKPVPAKPVSATPVPDTPSGATTPVTSPAPAPSGGVWVLEKTDFVVEKVDAAFMQKSHPTESGGDGSGSAGSTFGDPPRSWNMKISWTPPPRVLVPGKEVEFRVTVSDAGSSDPGAGGFGSIGANCPDLSAVWYGPSAGFDLKTGQRSKEASKAYTPPKARPGSILLIIADYGVYSRRQQYIYTYKFSLDGANAPAPVTASPAPPEAPLVEATVFDSMNIYGVANQPTSPSTFTIRRPQVITSIMTYHWNSGRGTRTGTIALRDATGRIYGPWPATGAMGQGGVPNASWTCQPNVEVPAGTYTIVDSEPATWSQNPQSGGRGMAVVRGAPKQ